jgi:predicted RNA-binding Zn-ribbon protein involved in translation (DUF1610 family)
MLANRSTVQACPFCSSNNADIFERDEQLWSVSCPNCGAIGPEADSVNMATKLWNHGAVRQNTDSLTEQNERKELLR